MLGILRRIARIRTDVTKAARHADAVGFDETAIVVIARIRVVPLGIPAARSRLVERGIRKQPQPDDAGRVPVERSDRHRTASRTDRNTRVLRLVLEGVGRAIGAPHVEPESVAVLARSGALVETGLVDESEITPARIAAVLQARVIRHGLQEIEDAGAIDRQLVPQSVVAAGPDDPVVAAFHRGLHGVGRRDARHVGRELAGDLRRVLRHAVVHVAEVVLVGCGKAAGRCDRRRAPRRGRCRRRVRTTPATAASCSRRAPVRRP